jgi:hypothetical protein
MKHAAAFAYGNQDEQMKASSHLIKNAIFS